MAHTTSEHCRDCGAAVNVKGHGLSFIDGGTESQRSRADAAATESWWAEADAIAQRHGYDGAAACGRSGGWCAPYVEHVTDSHRSNGGRVTEYMDDDTAPRFVAFAADIDALLKRAPEMFAAHLASVIEADAQREAAEARAAAMPGRLAHALRRCAEAEAIPPIAGDYSRQRDAIHDAAENARAILADYDKDNNA